MAQPIKQLQLVVQAIDEPAEGIKRFILTDAEEWRLPAFRAGAHIDLHLGGGMVRTYSLCNDPADNRRYVLAVKRELAGQGGSKLMHDNLSAGTTIGVSVPRGGMQAHPESLNIFVAGGIGITPFISLIRMLEREGRTNYVLHWACMGEPPLLDMIQPAYEAGRVVVYNTLQVPPPDIEGLLNSHDDAYAFCCGPAGMLDAFEVATEQWAPERKHVERFTAQKPISSLNAVPYTVVLAKTKREAEVLPEVGLLATLESLNADVSFSCAAGICGACKTRWLEGPPIHHDKVLSPDERKHEVMVCVAECAGKRLVLDL